MKVSNMYLKNDLSETLYNEDGTKVLFPGFSPSLEDQYNISINSTTPIIITDFEDYINKNAEEHQDYYRCFQSMIKSCEYLYISA
jgi:hypothetical protein